jgi:uncharacterized protein YecT (DUF1311 family)
MTMRQMKSIKRPILVMLALLLSSISIAGMKPSTGGNPTVRESANAQKPPDDPCPNAQTQGEMNQCAGNAYKAADGELNQLYRKLVAMLDAEGKIQLKAAQTAWLKYRDAHCEFVADQYKGGSMRPMIHAFCLADVTKDRTTELKDNVEERSH